MEPRISTMIEIRRDGTPVMRVETRTDTGYGTMQAVTWRPLTDDERRRWDAQQARLAEAHRRAEDNRRAWWEHVRRGGD